MDIEVKVKSEAIKDQESISNNENATTALIDFGKQNETINPIKQRPAEIEVIPYARK